MPRSKGRTTERGLGWTHQKRRARLLKRHIDGTPCPCQPGCGPGCICASNPYGLPMYRDPARNPDGLPLDADHSIARALGGTHADRLLLATCNRSRGTGATGPETTRNWGPQLRVPASHPSR